MNDVVNKSAAQKEASKSREERAQDVAYTLNHAISCCTTDVLIQPPIGVWVEGMAEQGKLPRWITGIFESHDHHGGGHKHEDAHAHDAHAAHEGHQHREGHEHHHAEEHSHQEHAFEELHAHGPGLFKNAGHWFLGEAMGDVGAVPLTILVQRHAPGFMHALRKLLEPVAAPFFHKGAHRDAVAWAKRGGVGLNSPEIKERENALYEHEMSHLPQAVVWNLFSVPINIGSQLMTRKKMNMEVLGVIAAGKVFGCITSNGLLIGGRAFAPESFERWDQFSSKHVVVPAASVVGKLFGVDKKAIVKEATQQQDDGWAGRVTTGADTSQIART